MTTNWVLGKQSESFPLLYHWRVLPELPPRQGSTPDEQAEIERMAAYWDDLPAVRERLEAIARATAHVVLFLEYIPQSLHAWLEEQAAIGSEAIASACAMMERGLQTVVPFMNAMGLLHFDAHAGNILTDGRQLYFADFGLAISSRFELSEAELAFFDIHKRYDECYTVTQLINWLVRVYTGASKPADLKEGVQRYAVGDIPSTVPPSVAVVIKRYAPIAVILNDFWWKLRWESRATPYPAEEIQRAYDAAQ